MSSPKPSTSAEASMADKETVNAEETPATAENNPTEGEPFNDFVKPDKVLGSYQRKTICKWMREKGSSGKTYSDMLKKYKISKSSLKTYLNKSAKRYQNIARMEHSDKTFSNATAIADYMTRCAPQSSLEYDTGCIVKAVEALEDHPDPEDVENVDFEDIYRFLGDVMLGKPTRELSPESHTFLADQFVSLMEEVNSPQGEADANKIMETIKNSSDLLISLEERFKVE